MAKPTKAEIAAAREAKFREICLLTKNGSFGYSAATDHKEWLKDGLVEINANDVYADGEIATRATEKGLSTMATSQQVSAPTAKAVPAFTIIKHVAPPVVERQGGRTDLYPWEQLAEGEIGHGFFVPATEKQPEPHKSLSSSVSTANRRFESKQVSFKAFAIADGKDYGHPGVKGAAVHRVEFKEIRKRDKKASEQDEG